ncbi:hypothetical protein FJT64_010236 [Amphibalanus amphitrite]|uniref:Uncharacterized protein n=1 Tax=Amphibalanus amphitrite TaxID=1232801 RepID=A0A6A4VJF8_AMPAM|nr:hypothetical protein FJT64_010236 [Amphibalanus amphitrite]
MHGGDVDRGPGVVRRLAEAAALKFPQLHPYVLRKYAMTRTQLRANLSHEERRKFVDAPRLVASHEVEQDINSRQLRNIGRPCFNLKAIHQPATARKKSAQDAGGLEPVVQLTEGAKGVISNKVKVSCDLPYVTLDDDRVLAEEHEEKLTQQRDEAQKRRSGREFRWGAAVAKRALDEEALELRDLERESDKARARRLCQLQFDWIFSARCGELDTLLAAEVKRQDLANQEIADLERLGAYQQAELAKRREDAIFSERLGELDMLISELEAEACFMMGQRDALYCSEEAVEIEHDTKRGEYLAESTAYDEAKRLKREVARLRHAHRKRGYYGVNDQGWFVACGPAQPGEEDQVRLSTYNKFDALEHQPTLDSDEEAEVPKQRKDKRRRNLRRKSQEVDNFDELLAEAARWDSECGKLGAPPKPSLVAYQALAQRRATSFGKRVEGVISNKVKVSCDLPYVTLDDDRVLAEEHEEKLTQQRDEAQKRRSGREFRWGAAVAKRALDEEALELRDLERESDKARARRLCQLQFDWIFSARCGELDTLLAAEVKRQDLANQEIADLERLGAYQQAELAKRREDAIFSERLGELDMLISELEAEACFMMGQRDALYCSEEAVEIEHDTKRGEYLAESTAYDEAKRLKREVARLRHAHRKRGYYGVNDQGWFVACGPAQPGEEDQVRLSTYNKFDALEHQPTLDSDEEAEVPKQRKDKRRRNLRRKSQEVDNFDELLAEAARWDSECGKLGAPPKPSLVAYQALAQRRATSFGKRVEGVISNKVKVSCDLPYVTLDDDRVLAEEHEEKLTQQRDEAQKRRSGREFRWGAAVAKRALDEEALELRDLERESDKARARRLCQLQFDWIFSARCGELDTLLAAEVKRQDLANQEIADLERLGAYQQAELAKRREDAIFSERLGELDMLISELEAEACFMMGQRDALYCSEEAVEIEHDTKRGEYLAESTAYDEAKRLKREVARLRHAHRKRGYYGVNDQGWFVACGPAQPGEEDQVRLSTYNKFDALEHQPTLDSDEEAEVPKQRKDKRRRNLRRKSQEVDNFDELLAEAASDLCTVSTNRIHSWSCPPCLERCCRLEGANPDHFKTTQLKHLLLRKRQLPQRKRCSGILEEWSGRAADDGMAKGEAVLWLSRNDVYSRYTGLPSFDDDGRRLPPFCADDMGLWLAQVDCACRVAGITDDAIKFDLVAANLPQTVAAQGPSTSADAEGSAAAAVDPGEGTSGPPEIAVSRRADPSSAAPEQSPPATYFESVPEMVKYMAQEVAGTGRSVTMDRFFTSVPLVED